MRMTNAGKMIALIVLLFVIVLFVLKPIVSYFDEKNQTQKEILYTLIEIKAALQHNER